MWVITSLLGRAFGYWPTIWKALLGVAHAVWTAVTYPVPVPAILLVFVVVLAALYVRRKYAAARPGPKPATRSHGLSDNETKVLRVVAATDGNRLFGSEIAREIGLSNLATQQAVTALLEHDLLDFNSTAIGTEYFLSQMGVKFVIEQGYVR